MAKEKRTVCPICEEVFGEQIEEIIAEGTNEPKAAFLDISFSVSEPQETQASVRCNCHDKNAGQEKGDNSQNPKGFEEFKEQTEKGREGNEAFMKRGNYVSADKLHKALSENEKRVASLIEPAGEMDRKNKD